jgi:hypothetical protein
MNYAQLVATVRSYLEADLSTTDMDTAIQQAERRIYNSVQFTSLKQNVTGSTTSGNRYLYCPDDFLAAYSLAVIDSSGVYSYLVNKDANFIREAYPAPTDTGVPRYYAMFGPRSTGEQELTFLLGPTPNAAYTMELQYFYYPESIVTAGTTWLGDNFDPVLLYGTLVEVYTFMKGEADLLGVYEAKYKEALALAKRLGDGLERRDAYRSGQTRIEVP